MNAEKNAVFAANQAHNRVRFMNETPEQAIEYLVAQDKNLSPSKVRHFFDNYGPDDIGKRMKEAIDSAKQMDPVNRYQRLGGEAEARLVQSRMNLTPEQRLSQYPWNPDYFKQQTGVGLDDLIHRFDGGEAKSITYPQDAALETARQNGVKMLGLPENNTALDRAKALGHSYIGIHYTPSDFNSFKIGTRPDNFAAWSTLDPSANMAAHNIGHTGNISEGVQGMPLMARIENRMPLTEKRVIGVSSDFPRSVTELDASKAVGAGYDNAKIGSELAIFDPSRIRSRFAAFDPARVNENDLLAGAMPFGLLLDPENRAKLGF